MKRHLFIGMIFLASLLLSCQKDDICAEAAPTTPRLIIEFYDINNPTQSKAVNNFNARALNKSQPVFDQVKNGNTIKIPLRTDNNVTQYAFTLNANAEPSDNFQANTDSLTLSYGLKETYLNRACGYKVTFVELSVDLNQESGGTNWIETIEVLRPNTVRNEQNAHLYIYF